MKKVLIAVDDTKGTKSSFALCNNLCSCMKPQSVILLYVEKFEGRSLIDEMLGDAEMSTLKEVLTGSEYKEALDTKAQRVLNFYKKSLEENGVTGVNTVIREGHPAEEILGAAEELGVDLIMVGSKGHRVSHTFMGSVSMEVVNRANVPVFVAKQK
jgi:nucleotide-binding universal stress UspA family protein